MSMWSRAQMQSSLDIKAQTEILQDSFDSFRNLTLPQYENIVQLSPEEMKAVRSAKGTHKELTEKVSY